MKFILWIIPLLFGSASAWGAADCTQPQAIKRGTYRIVSTMPDHWCLELLPDNRSLHYNQCAQNIHQKNQQFTIGADEPHNGDGCFGMKAEGDTLETVWVQDTTSALSDPDILVVSPNNGPNIYWFVKDNGDGTLRFISAHVPTAQAWCVGSARS